MLPVTVESSLLQNPVAPSHTL
uniref:Uncharacterized protein n=1 Tax=Rhizophora mucronata TaxID=61149 RepID=A0A2P2PP61_RHIMU